MCWLQGSVHVGYKAVCVADSWKFTNQLPEFVAAISLTYILYQFPNSLLQLVFVSGSFKAHGGEPFLTAIVRPVSPPSILEIRMEGNMFVTHYTLDFHCTFFDGR